MYFIDEKNLWKLLIKTSILHKLFCAVLRNKLSFKNIGAGCYIIIFPHRVKYFITVKYFKFQTPIQGPRLRMNEK